MLVDSMSHEFGQGPMGMPCSCSLMSEASAGKVRRLELTGTVGSCNHLKASSLTRPAPGLGGLKEDPVHPADWVTDCCPLLVVWPLTAWQMDAKRRRWKLHGLLETDPWNTDYRFCHILNGYEPVMKARVTS